MAHRMLRSAFAAATLLIGLGAGAGARAQSSAWRVETPLAGGITDYAHAQCWGDSSGSYYVIGGINAAREVTAAVWRYDTNDGVGSWTALAPLPVPTRGAAAACVGGRIFVAGGASPGTARLLQVYAVATNTWSTGPGLPRPAQGAALGARGDSLFLIGGVGGGTRSREVNVFSLSRGAWIGRGQNLPLGVSHAGWATAGRFVYLVGGWTDASPGANSARTLRYNMGTDQWSEGPPLPAARASLGLAATSTHLYAFGGDADGGGLGDATAVHERLPLRGWPSVSWESVTPLSAPRRGNPGGFCTASSGMGRIWSVGGQSADGTILGTTESRWSDGTEPCLQMLGNNSFEFGSGIPSLWEGKNLGSGDQRSTLQRRWGAASFRFRGGPGTKELGRAVAFAGAAGQRIVLSGWNLNMGTAAAGGAVRIRAAVTFADGSRENFDLEFPRGPHGWAMRSRAFAMNRPFRLIRVGLQVTNQQGSSFFDGVGLLID